MNLRKDHSQSEIENLFSYRKIVSFILRRMHIPGAEVTIRVGRVGHCSPLALAHRLATVLDALSGALEFTLSVWISYAKTFL